MNLIELTHAINEGKVYVNSDKIIAIDTETAPNPQYQEKKTGRRTLTLVKVSDGGEITTIRVDESPLEVARLTNANITRK